MSSVYQTKALIRLTVKSSTAAVFVATQRRNILNGILYTEEEKYLLGYLILEQRYVFMNVIKYGKIIKGFKYG